MARPIELNACASGNRMPSVWLWFDQSSYGGGEVLSSWGEVIGVVQQAPGEECQPFEAPCTVCLDPVPVVKEQDL